MIWAVICLLISLFMLPIHNIFSQFCPSNHSLSGNLSDLLLDLVLVLNLAQDLLSNTSLVEVNQAI